MSVRMNRLTGIAPVFTMRRVARSNRARHTRRYRVAPVLPEFGESLLVCATEAKTDVVIASYVDNMTRIIGRRFQPAPCVIKPAKNSN